MPKSVEFWCYLEISLSDVFARFCDAFPVVDFTHDAENVWEWFDGNSSDGRVGFNICREHSEFEDNYTVPVRLSLLLHDPALNEQGVGRILASSLGTRVFARVVEYLGENDFRFLKSQSFDAGE